MTTSDLYRESFEHEVDSNSKMLAMIASVPADRRSDPRFQRAVNLAAHLCACRENFYDMIAAEGHNRVDWWEESAAFESLSGRFAAMEKKWSAFLASIDQLRLESDFVIDEGEWGRFRVGVEAQIIQLLGHAFYHRGQIAMLVDELGGETVDTDYIDWALPRNSSWGLIE